MNTLDRVAQVECASPEQRLIAAQLIEAMKGCRMGDHSDCKWLERRGYDALLVVAPSDRLDVDVLARNLIPTTRQLRMAVAA